MARASGHAPSTIRGASGEAFGLQPHRSRRPGLSDPFFVETESRARSVGAIWQTAGSCAGSCVHEEEPDRPWTASQVLPMRPGCRPKAQPRCYECADGTWPLSSRPSSEGPMGRVRRRVFPRHRARFRNSIARFEANVAWADLDIHTVDGQLRPHRPRRSATGSPNGVRAGRPISRPTAISWLNQVRWFGLLTDKTDQSAASHRPPRTSGAHHPRLHRHDKPAPRQTLQMRSSNPPMTSSAPSSGSASEQSKSLNSRRKSYRIYRNQDTSSLRPATSRGRR